MRKKQHRFKDNDANPLMLQPGKILFDTIKGKWKTFFNNNHPLVLELGCGTGNYTLGLATKNERTNFIGVDIKGARMWVGLQEALVQKLNNVAFLRTRIEILDHFFCPEEVSTIYITFPDPRIKDRDIKRRLTSERFLDIYKKILKIGGYVHLKTDNAALYHFTLGIVQKRGYSLVDHTEDLYKSHSTSIHTALQTVYEKKFLEKGCKIKYLCFQML